MELSWIALLSLVLAIGIGVKTKMNTGIIAISIAFILGKLGGISEGEIMSGFGTTLFLMLLGVMYLFGIAQVNGTIELLAKKILSIVGKRTNLIPIILYFVCIFISAIGPGCIPTLAIMSVFAVALSKELNISPLILAPIGYLGTAVGGLSPLASTGIIGMNLAEEQGIEGANIAFIVGTFIAITIVVFMIYFALGAHKINQESPIQSNELPNFNKQQKNTLLGIFVLVLIVVLTGFNVGLTSFVIGTVLILLGAATEKETLGTISWGTLILVTGFGVLMSVIQKLGGIQLLSYLLSLIMNDTIAPAVMSVTSSILGLFSSTSGVVMPTMISTIPDIVANVGGDISSKSLIVAIIAGAHMGGLSPITGGSLILSAYATVGKSTFEEQQKLYLNLYKMALAGAVVVAIVSITGVFNLF